MRIVISQDNDKLYRSKLLSLDPSMEIIALNPLNSKIGRAHVRTPVTEKSRMPSSA